MKEEINDTTRYSPLPVEIFLQKAQSEWQSTYEGISDSLKTLETSEEKRIISDYFKRQSNNH